MGTRWGGALALLTWATLLLVVHGAVEVSAGKNLIVPAGTTNVQIFGKATGPEPIVLQWKQTEGSPTVLRSTDARILVVDSFPAPGLYGYTLTATAADGTVKSDQALVYVQQGAAGTTPTVDAGRDLSITLPQSTVTLRAKGPAGARFSWTQLSGPNSATLAGAATDALTAANLVKGSYTFKVDVTGAGIAPASDSVRVDVLVPSGTGSNRPPTVYVQPTYTLQLPENSLAIPAKASDPDGSIVDYSWSQTAGPTVAFVGRFTDTIKLTGLAPGAYEFVVQVTDNQGGSATGRTQLSVRAANRPPVIAIVPQPVITLAGPPAEPLAVSASIADPDGDEIKEVVWKLTSGPSSVEAVDANTPNLKVKNLQPGVFVFTVTARDALGAASEQPVTIKVGQPNRAPAITLPRRSVLYVLPSTSPVALSALGNDPDGDVLSYGWEVVSTPAGASAPLLVNGQSASLQVSGITAPGEYKFRVTATDPGGLSANDLVTVVATATPAVSAGSDVSLSIPFSACTVSYGRTGPVVTLPPSKVVLNASVQSYDPAYTRLSWRQVSGQRVERVEGLDTLAVKLFDLVPGKYVWEFTATDTRSGIAASDAVEVNVNVGPTVVGSADVTLRLPNNSAVLTAAATDVDGRIVSYRWSQAAGTPATLGDVTTPKLLVSNLVEGQYAFAVEVVDDSGAKATATIKVSVVKMNRPPSVQFTRKMPIVVVAPQQPTVAQLTIAVLASDPDGDELTYAWTQQSGPALQLEGADTARVRLPLLREQGTYTVAVKVQDTSRATTTLIAEINAVAMGAVHAGDDRVVTVPFASVKISEVNGKKVVEMPPSRNTIEGTAKSVSGEARYYWRQLSGPAVNTDGNGTLALSIIDALPGTYEYQLTVQDFASGLPLPPVSDQVSVHVNVGPAALLGADLEVDLPGGSSVEVQGKGIDLDGRITGYSWRQVSGPTQAMLTAADTPTMRASNLVEGRYRFALTVTDNDMATGEASVLVTVNGAPIMTKRSVAPDLVAVDAGTTMLVAWPDTQTIQLRARSNDGADDGSVTYKWTQQSGPGTATFSNFGEGSAVQATLPSPGVYKFLVSAYKGGAVVNSTVQVTSSWSPVITAEGASAELPAQGGVVLRALVQDPNDYSSPPSVTWEQLENGMPLARLSDTTSPTVTVSCLNPGTYSLRAKATNAAGISSRVDVPVTVSSGSPFGRLDKWVTGFVVAGCVVGWLIAALMGPYGFAFSALQHAQLVASLVFVRGIALPPALLELASGLSWTLGQLPLSQSVYDRLGVTNGKRTIADVCAGAVVDEGNFLASVLIVLFVGAAAAVLHALVWFFSKGALKRELPDAVGFPSRTILFAQYFLPGVALAAALIVNEVRRVASGAQTATTVRHLLFTFNISTLQPNAKSLGARLGLAVVALIWVIFVTVKLRNALLQTAALYDGPRQRLADITVQRYRFGGAPGGSRIALTGDVEQGRKTVGVEKQRLLSEGIVLSDAPTPVKSVAGQTVASSLVLHTTTGPWRVVPERLEPSGRYLSSYGELVHRFREGPAATAYPVLEAWEAVVRALVLGIFILSDGATGGRTQLAGLLLLDALLCLYVLAAWPFVDSLQDVLEVLRRAAQAAFLGLLLALVNGGDASPRGPLVLAALLLPAIVTFVLLLNQIRCLLYAVIRRRLPDRAPPPPKAPVRVLTPSMKRIRPEERAEAVFRTSIYVPHMNRTFNVFVPPLVNIPFERRFAGCDRVLQRGFALDVDAHTGAVFFLYDARRMESVVYSDEVKRKIGAMLVKRKQEALESVPNADQFPFFDDLDISLTAAREAALSDPSRPQYPEYNMQTYSRTIACIPGRPYVEGMWRGYPFELVGYEFELPLRREHFGAARIAASLDRVCGLAKTSSPNFLRIYDYFALRDFSDSTKSRVRVVTVAEPTEKPLLKFLASLDTGGNAAELDEILCGIVCQVIVAVHSAQNASFDGKPIAFRHGDLSPANIAVKLSEPLRRRLAGAGRPSYGEQPFADPNSKRFLFYEVAEKYLVGPSGERQYMPPVSLTVDLSRVPIVKIVNFSTSSARVLTHHGAVSDEIVRGHLAPPVLLSESYDLKFFAISLQQTLDMYRQRLGPTPPAVRQLLNAMAGADLGQLPAPGERIEIVDSFVALPRTLLDHPSLHTLRTRGAEAGLHPSYANALHYVEHPHDRVVDSVDLPH